MRAERILVKSAIGATTVTLVAPASPLAVSESKPGVTAITQVVVTTGAATPDVGFWGTTTTDGVKYRVTIERMS